jgi:hypothetical protein
VCIPLFAPWVLAHPLHWHLSVHVTRFFRITTPNNRIAYEVVSQLQQAEEFVRCLMTNSISLTFLKIRSRPCSWWSRRKTPLPPPWLKFPTLLFKIHAPHRCFFCQPLLKRQHPTLVCPLSLEREGWKMVAGGGSVAVPPLPRRGLKPP